LSAPATKSRISRCSRQSVDHRPSEPPASWTGSAFK